ncbi:MAG: TIGR04255 family protein [Cyanobacteria bacterium P01_A01_bin.114]
MASKFVMGLDETFPTLDFAPSIEAVIHWQASATKPLRQDELSAQLSERLPEYPTRQTQYAAEFSALSRVDGSSQIAHRNQWNGFRLQTIDGRYVVQFAPANVVFSRLEPYEGWREFQRKAMEVWDIFLELAKPTEIGRLGVRFINRISLIDNESPAEYLQKVQPPPSGIDLPTESFFYQDTYQVPGYPYRINWGRTVQPQQPDPQQGKTLLVDIDVFTVKSLSIDRELLIKRLTEMRWLKNKFFFSCITDKALEQFRGKH